MDAKYDERLSTSLCENTGIRLTKKSLYAVVVLFYIVVHSHASSGAKTFTDQTYKWNVKLKNQFRMKVDTGEN